MLDEPLVVPVTPGSALVRLAQLTGTLRRRPEVAAALPVDIVANLQECRDQLWRALEGDAPDAVEAALRQVQDHLHRLYHSVSSAASEVATDARSHEALAALGFPPACSGLQPVDVRTVIASFSRPARQMLTTLSFLDAGGATAYWLQEIRCPGDGERVEDYVLESNAPLFPRLRLPGGRHTFRIESRNNSEFVLSPEFVIDVPHNR